MDVHHLITFVLGFAVGVSWSYYVVWKTMRKNLVATPTVVSMRKGK